jgi:hypothetical protein
VTVAQRVRRRALVLGGAAAALLAAGALAWFGRGEPSVSIRPESERPVLLLVTSLPLIFPEEFSLEGLGSPALEALEKRYRVEPIGIADARALRGGRLLLMAHPLAQPADALVELDRWMRGGGRALILADPRLEWPSRLALGDRLRPPPAYADTGLLAHWGLRLSAPDEAGPVSRTVGGREVRTVAAGTLVPTRPECSIAAEGFVARCAVGKGEATVVADADFLNVGMIEGGEQSGNLPFLLAELERLER